MQTTIGPFGSRDGSWPSNVQTNSQAVQPEKPGSCSQITGRLDIGIIRNRSLASRMEARAIETLSKWSRPAPLIRHEIIYIEVDALDAKLIDLRFPCWERFLRRGNFYD
jgi:hypothetical protein